MGGWSDPANGTAVRLHRDDQVLGHPHRLEAEPVGLAGRLGPQAGPEHAERDPDLHRSRLRGEGRAGTGDRGPEIPTDRSALPPAAHPAIIGRAGITDSDVIQPVDAGGSMAPNAGHRAGMGAGGSRDALSRQDEPSAAGGPGPGPRGDRRRPAVGMTSRGPGDGVRSGSGPTELDLELHGPHPPHDPLDAVVRARRGGPDLGPAPEDRRRPDLLGRARTDGDRRPRAGGPPRSAPSMRWRCWRWRSAPSTGWSGCSR